MIIHNVILFNDWVGRLCCVDRIIPKANHYPVNIKHLVSIVLI